MSARQSLSVSYASGDRLAIDVRGHHLETDQPVDAGGTDSAPTPTELFVVSLAACMAFYAQRFLRRNEVPAAGLRIDVSFETVSDGGARVSSIDLDVELPAGTPERLRAPIERVMDHCTVHNTIRHAPEIVVRVR